MKRYHKTAIFHDCYNLRLRNFIRFVIYRCRWRHLTHEFWNHFPARLLKKGTYTIEKKLLNLGRHITRSLKPLLYLWLVQLPHQLAYVLHVELCNDQCYPFVKHSEFFCMKDNKHINSYHDKKERELYKKSFAYKQRTIIYLDFFNSDWRLVNLFLNHSWASFKLTATFMC